MQISAPWLDTPAVQHVCKVLEDAGHQALFVGGCVRNTLLDQPVSDHDLSTNAHPDRVTELMEAAGLKVVPTGIAHGTVTVVAAGEPFEITTFRHDIETDGRRAVVHFADTVIEDARRRDFTMNAIYCDCRGEIHDPLNGLPDLRERRLRFVGNAAERVQEDFLRILRFFRFNAWYADSETGIDADALDACGRYAGGLTRISAERIGSEIRKLLAAPDPAPSVAVMQTTGVLNTVLPGADVTALPVLIHLEAQLEREADPILRLAALGGEAVSDRLRLSRAETRRLEKLGLSARSEQGPGELGYRLGSADGMSVLILRCALMGVTVPRASMGQVDLGAAAVFPVAPRDLVSEFEGPALGARIREIERKWIDSGFSLDRAALLA